MATKKAGKATAQYMDPNPKFFGVKLSHGSLAIAGNIILTQLGNKYYPGFNVVQGRNFTLNATHTGRVEFVKKSYGKKALRTYVNVIVSDDK